TPLQRTRPRRCLPPPARPHPRAWHTGPSKPPFPRVRAERGRRGEKATGRANAGTDSRAAPSGNSKIPWSLHERVARPRLAPRPQVADNPIMNPPTRATRPPDAGPRPRDLRRAFPGAPALRPRALRPGSRIALLAPAGPVEPERLERSRDRCRALDLEPVVFPAANARHGYLAGSDAARLADLQAAFD